MADDTSKPTPTPNSAIPNDPTRTQYDPSKPWSNIYNILTNRMTPVGKFHYREDAYIKNEDRDCTNCEEWRDWLFKYSPMIIFLQKNIRDLNGELNASNVRCRRCPARLEEAEEDGGKKEGGEGRWETGMKGYGKDGEEKPIKVYRQGGGFSPDHGILICANEMRNRKHLEDTLAHEMVHAWDHLRWKVDWADLRHAACTEIRASSLSGECRWTREFFTRNNFTITQQHQNCVRARAVRSVMARPSCKDDVQAVKVVNEVWDSCFSDTRPFDEIYR